MDKFAQHRIDVLLGEGQTTEFGEVLFGDERTSHGKRMNKILNRPNERDTEIESKIADKLKRWYGGVHIGRKKDEFVDLFRKLKEVQHEYPDELVPSTNNLGRVEFFPLVNAYYLLMIKNIEPNTGFDYTYIAKSPIQSGTSIQNEEEFNIHIMSMIGQQRNAGYGIHEKQRLIGMILHSIIPEDQLVINDKLSKAFGSPESNEDQKETIRISKEPLKCRASFFLDKSLFKDFEEYQDKARKTRESEKQDEIDYENDKKERMRKFFTINKRGTE